MGRRAVAPEDRRVKCHTANVMIPQWASNAYSQEAINSDTPIKSVISDALTREARRLLRKQRRLAAAPK